MIWWSNEMPDLVQKEDSASDFRQTLLREARNARMDAEDFRSGEYLPEHHYVRILLGVVDIMAEAVRRSGRDVSPEERAAMLVFAESVQDWAKAVRESDPERYSLPEE